MSHMNKNLTLWMFVLLLVAALVALIHGTDVGDLIRRIHGG
jgi:hypothetical protein